MAIGGEARRPRNGGKRPLLPTGRQKRLLAGLADAGGYPTVGDLLRRFGSEVEEFTRRDAERVLTAIYLRPRVPPYDGGARGG